LSDEFTLRRREQATLVDIKELIKNHRLSGNSFKWFKKKGRMALTHWNQFSNSMTTMAMCKVTTHEAWGLYYHNKDLCKANPRWAKFW
jgi:hypothetical protein